jgi:thioredoxin 1
MLQEINPGFHPSQTTGKVVVDFYSSTCVPCKKLMPIVEELSNEHLEVQFYKVNVEEHPDLAGDYMILSVPTVLFFENGELVDQSIGLVSKDVLKNKLN